MVVRGEQETDSDHGLEEVAVRNTYWIGGTVLDNLSSTPVYTLEFIPHTCKSLKEEKNGKTNGIQRLALRRPELEEFGISDLEEFEQKILLKSPSEREHDGLIHLFIGGRKDIYPSYNLRVNGTNTCANNYAGKDFNVEIFSQYPTKEDHILTVQITETQYNSLKELRKNDLWISAAMQYEERART